MSIQSAITTVIAKDKIEFKKLKLFDTTETQGYETEAQPDENTVREAVDIVHEFDALNLKSVDETVTPPTPT